MSSRLSLSELDRIPQIKLSLDDVRYHHPHMPDDVADARLLATVHECAHLVAGIMCDSYVSKVDIAAGTGRGARTGIGGACRTMDILPEHEAFVYFAGHVIESCMPGGDTNLAADDLAYGKRAAGSQWQEIYRRVERAFATESRALWWAVVGTTLLMPRTGVLDRTPLRSLVRWLSPHVPRYSEAYPELRIRDWGGSLM